MSGQRRVGQTRSRYAGKHLLLATLAVFMLFPLVLTVSTAFKTQQDVRTNPFGLFSSFSWDNLATAWTVGRFGDYVPFFTYMIPLYFQLRSMGMLDSLLGTNLVLASTQLSFGTFLMRAFFTDLPGELAQAARMDGASEWQIFLRVMLPLTTSGLGFLAVYTFLQNWNNFLVPLLYMPGGEYRPLTMGLYLFVGGRTFDIGPLAAGTLITILPVVLLFVVLQRQVTEGFSGAVKG